MTGAVERLARAVRRAWQDEDSRLRDQYPDFDAADFDTLTKVRPYTMTSPERVHALVEAVKYVVRRRIPGAIVECGVWRGGSMLAVAHTLHRLGDLDRHLYLFDTFEGMSPPTARDVDLSGRGAADLLADASPQSGGSYWCYASLEDVKRTLGRAAYPDSHVHFVRGPVEQTVPSQAPPEISLLRLDTDWYESTRHELTHLYPRLASGGVLIIDDYGHWKGARQATDEFIAATPNFGMLVRIDYTGRLVIKP
jgi:O-methyltransferase